MPAAVRRGLLGSLNVPCQAAELIRVEPLPADVRFPSAFGRVMSVAVERNCDVWDAIEIVRLDHEPVRHKLRGALRDPKRVRSETARHRLGLDRPEWQTFFGLDLAVVTGGVSRGAHAPESCAGEPNVQTRRHALSGS